MKIDIFSDLHLDHWMAKLYRDRRATQVLRDFIASGKTEATNVIFAGDAGNGYAWYTLVVKTLKEFYDVVIATPGNHDFYKRDGDMLADHTMVGYMEGNIFVANPLWTNFRNKDGFGRLAQNSISDFHQIEALCKHFDDSDGPWKLMQHMHKLGRDTFLEERPDIAVSHFAPIVQSIHPKYEGDALNTYFCNADEEMFLEVGAKLWVHGHTHSAMDYVHKGTRVVAHPIGYPYENYSELVGIPMKTVEI